MNDEIYNLRVERLTDEHNERVDSARQEAETIRGLQNDRRDALAQGDRNTAKYFDKEICEAEGRYLALLRDIQPPQQQGQLTQAKAEYVTKHADQLLRPHWSGLKDASGRPFTNLEAISFAHDRAAAMGILEDSREYFEALDVVGPQGEPTTITTGDEALAMTRRGKHGQLSAREYNEQVRRLAWAKSRGDYRDK
jgi:hypothetical protein